MNDWEFHNPTRIVLKKNSSFELEKYICLDRVLLISSKFFRLNGFLATIERKFGDKIVATIDDVKSNPDINSIDMHVEQIRLCRPNVIIAIGGGSSIDTAKIIAKMLAQTQASKLIDIINNRSGSFVEKSLPVVAIPTTAGTGAEVTSFATVWDFKNDKKYSFADQDLYPKISIVDSTLTYSLPKDITIFSGLDAISHALESVWNKNANAITLSLASQSLALSLKALRDLNNSLSNKAARDNMMQASLLAGLAISQTKTALAHSISYPLTTNFSLPHGIAASFTLPSILCFNLVSDDGRIENFAKLAGFQTPNDLASEIKTLFKEIHLAEIFYNYIPEPNKIYDLTHKMIDQNRSKNNIRSLRDNDVKFIIDDSLQNLFS
jgi:phosphonate metabolism-associated iron-containing alcohol dehydrogenase